MSAYDKLVECFREIAILESCHALLNWDQETGLPPKAVPFRASQRAYLSERIHKLKTAQEVGTWLDGSAAEIQDDDSEESANVRWWRHQYERSTKIPADLIGVFQEASSLALDAWQEARRQNDYGIFRAHLQKLLDYNCQMADLWGFDDSPYDALLEEYERGARTETLTQLFIALRPELVAIADEAIEQQERTGSRKLEGDFPVDHQKAFNREVCQALGFDFDAGRIDTTVHPFCSRLSPHDTRLTTRYDVRDFTSSLFGVMHEAGHGLYEQGLPQEKFALPSGASVSLGVHESQSRLWENQVGRSRAFWEVWLPKASDHFPQLGDWTPEEMTAAVNRAVRSHIRVEADEVTYDLHIILRFEIERQLVERRLSVDELPDAWNAKFVELLGLKVTNDNEGCLQDIHWSMGAFGYFPTYTLGNLNAAQLFQHALSQSRDLSNEIAAGNYAGLLDWLRREIHRHGCRYLPGELIVRATGRPTEAGPYIDHLRCRYIRWQT